MAHSAASPVAAAIPMAAEKAFAAAYAAQRDAGSAALRAKRAQAFACVAEAGLPHRKRESWRWTDLRPLAKTAFVAAERVNDALPDVEHIDPFAGFAAYRVVLVNGFFRPDLSAIDGLPDGMRITALADDPAMADLLGPPVTACADEGFIVALNTALVRDGVVVRVPAGVQVEKPIHIIHCCAGTTQPIAFHARVVVMVEQGAAATVLESQWGPQGTAYLSGHAVDVRIGANATLRHYRHQAEGTDAFNLSALRADIERDGQYESFLFATGARLSRNEAHVRLAGPGASVVLDGMYLMGGRQHFDATTIIEHAAPRCASREVFKGVVDGEAKGVFQGRIAVAQAAQQTDAHQLHKALLLSPRAEVDTKPELEIFADDVKCSHGAAIGELDANALFYLRARGIGVDEARALLIGAFIGEVLDSMTHEAARTALRGEVERWLQARSERVD